MTRQHVQEKMMVWSGEKKKTSSGLTKKDLMLNKHGKVVSKKQYKKGQELYKMMKKEGRLAEPFQKKSKSKSKSKKNSKKKSKVGGKNCMCDSHKGGKGCTPPKKRRGGCSHGNQSKKRGGKGCTPKKSRGGTHIMGIY